MLRPWMGKLYVQVLMGIFIGLLVGLFAPNIAVTLQPLADGFIKLIKMLLAPIIFATVVLGMAKMGKNQGSGAHRRYRPPVFRDHVDLSAVGRGNGSAERQYTGCWWLNRPNHPRGCCAAETLRAQRFHADVVFRS